MKSRSRPAEREREREREQNEEESINMVKCKECQSTVMELSRDNLCVYCKERDLQKQLTQKTQALENEQTEVQSLQSQLQDKVEELEQEKK